LPTTRAVLLLVGLLLSSLARAGDMTAEIDHLRTYLAASDCSYIRNGKAYSPAEAAAHIDEKYAHFRDRIHSAEDFIEWSASKSTLSGKPYSIDCPGQPPRTSQSWLLAELQRYREFGGSSGVLPPGLPFSEAVQVDNTLYLSGQMGVLPGSLELAPGGLAAESRQALENIRTILTSRGYTLRDVVKCTVMLADMSQWAAFNEVYRTFFQAPYPARSAFGASGLALGGQVEIECIAVKRREKQ